jgi:hypothetical protein
MEERERQLSCHILLTKEPGCIQYGDDAMAFIGASY